MDDAQFETSLKKFMNALGLVMQIEISNSSFFRGNRYVCIQIVVKHEGKIEFDQHYCYSLQGVKVKFEESNSSIRAQEGILRYFGNNGRVNSFFEKKARKEAKTFLDQYL